MHSAVWPSVAAQLAKNIAKASFAHDYDQVWGYLDPAYRKAVSQSHWRRCQGSPSGCPARASPSRTSPSRAPPSFRSGSRCSVASNVQQIELLIRFKTPAASGPQLAVLDTFWLKDGKTWTAVWLSDEYAAYKASKCYVTPQGPPLY